MARQPPAAIMPMSRGKSRGSEGSISSEPFEWIRSNLFLTLQRTAARSLTRKAIGARFREIVARLRKVEGRDLGIGKPPRQQRFHRPLSAVHIGNAARRPQGNPGR